MAKILAIDLGKYKSVACTFNTSDGEYVFQTVPTRPANFQDLFAAESPDRIVIEIGSQAGWVTDLAEAIGIEIEVANPNHDAWRWKNVSRKTDRDDALRLAQMSDLGSLPSVYMPKRTTRQPRFRRSSRRPTPPQLRCSGVRRQPCQAGLPNQCAHLDGHYQTVH